MMVRRTLLAVGAVVLVSSGAALAFAAEHARGGGFTRDGAGGAGSPLRGHTPDPSSGEPLRAAAVDDAEAQTGTYCPSPPTRDRSPLAAAGESAPIAGSPDDPGSGLGLHGQSAVPRPTASAVCTGVTGALTPVPAVVLP